MSRVEALEKNSRRVKRIAVVALILSAAAVVLGAAYAPRTVPRKIVAHEFDVLDGSGRVRIMLSALKSKDGSFIEGVDLFDRNGKIRIGLDMLPGLNDLTFLNENGTIMASFGDSSLQGDASDLELYPGKAVGPAGVSSTGFGTQEIGLSVNTNVWYSSSQDQGNTWTAPVRVNQGTTVGHANVFPWVAADASGHVVVTWYGDDRAGNSDDASTLAPCPAGSTTCMQQWAQWNVFAAETVDGTDASPIFLQAEVSDHVIHRGTVSTGGTLGSANRNLLDFFNAAFDPQHRANIAFADDHNVNPDCASIGSGACGPDDPNTARLIRSYFTYELQANPGVQTAGFCGAPPPPSPGNPSPAAETSMGRAAARRISASSRIPARSTARSAITTIRHRST